MPGPCGRWRAAMETVTPHYDRNIQGPEMQRKQDASSSAPKVIPLSRLMCDKRPAQGNT